MTPTGATCLGGYDFTPLLDGIKSSVVRRSPFAQAFLRLFFGTFVCSSGRQYDQLCGMFALVALHQQRTARSYDAVDWTIVYTGIVDGELAECALPGGHTGAPAKVPGLVGGVYRFWWQAFLDVIRYRYRLAPLPTDAELDERMEACGVPLHGTSSSSWEEMTAIHAAYGVYRDDPATVAESAARLVRRCVEPHLAREWHWQRYRRPRSRTHRDGPRPDPHAMGLRDHVRAALTTPAEARDLYDELLVLMAAELDALASGHGALRLRLLYRRLLDAYNTNHPIAPITVLHR